MPRTPITLVSATSITITSYPANLFPRSTRKLAVVASHPRLLKATIRTPMKDGKVDWEAVPNGSSIWVTAHDGALAGRHILVAKDPTGNFRIVRGGGVSHWDASKDAEGQATDPYRHRAINIGRSPQNKRDDEAREEQKRVQEANKPKLAQARALVRESRDRERGMLNSYKQALGIDKIDKDNLDDVKASAYQHGVEGGLNHDEATAFARSVASVWRREEEAAQNQHAETLGRVGLTQRLRAGRGSLADSEPSQPPATPQPYAVTLPTAQELQGKSAPEIEAAVNAAFEQARQNPQPVTSDEPELPDTVASDAAITDNADNPEGLGDSPSAPSTDAPAPPFHADPSAFDGIDEDSYNITSPTAPMQEPMKLKVGATIHPVRDEAAMGTALDAYHKVLETRRAEAEVRSTIQKAAKTGGLGDVNVAEMRERIGPVQGDEMESLINHYSHPETYSPDSFYTALGRHWDSDRLGYAGTIGEYANSGAQTAVAGLLGTELGSRYDVGRLIDAGGIELASVALAHRLRRELSKNDYDELIKRTKQRNATAIPQTEEAAMKRNDELLRDWDNIVSQSKSGELNLPDPSTFEGMQSDALERKVRGATDAQSLAAQNILERRANLGVAFGSMAASATFLHALEEAKKHTTTSLTLTLGNIPDDGVAERIEALRLREGKNARVSYHPQQGYSILTNSAALQKLVTETAGERDIADKLAAIKSNDRSMADDPYQPPFFNDTFVNEQGETTPFQLFPEQRNDIRFATQSQWPNGCSGGYITRTTGAGKTLIGLGVHAQRLADNPRYVGLSIVPNGRTSQWQGETNRYTSIPHVVIPENATLDEKRAVIATIKPGQMVIASHKDGARLSGEIQQHLDSLGLTPHDLGMVIDEVQELKSKAKGSDKQSAGSRAIQAIPVGTRVAMTATPARDSVVEAYDAVSWIAGKKALGPRSRFARTYAGYGEGTNAQQDAVSEMLYREISPYLSSGDETSRGYATHFHDVALTRSAGQRQAQADIETAAPQRIEARTKELLAQNPNTTNQQARIRATTEVAADHRRNLHGAAAPDNAGVQALLRNVGSPEQNSGKKHIIFVDSPQQRRALMDGLAQAGYRPNQVANIAGATMGKPLTTEQVEARKEQWKNDPNTPFIMIDRSTQSGHNLAQADSVHMLGTPDDAAGYLQAIGRARRASRRAGHDLDIYTYRHSDSPHEANDWYRLHRQRLVQQAVAPQMLKQLANVGVAHHYRQKYQLTTSDPRYVATPYDEMLIEYQADRMAKAIQPYLDAPSQIPPQIATCDRQALAIAGLILVTQPQIRQLLQRTLGPSAPFVATAAVAALNAAHRQGEETLARLQFHPFLQGGVDKSPAIGTNSLTAGLPMNKAHDVSSEPRDEQGRWKRDLDREYVRQNGLRIPNKHLWQNEAEMMRWYDSRKDKPAVVATLKRILFEHGITPRHPNPKVNELRARIRGLEAERRFTEADIDRLHSRKRRGSSYANTARPFQNSFERIQSELHDTQTELEPLEREYNDWHEPAAGEWFGSATSK